MAVVVKATLHGQIGQFHGLGSFGLPGTSAIEQAHGLVYYVAKPRWLDTLSWTTTKSHERPTLLAIQLLHRSRCRSPRTHFAWLVRSRDARMERRLTVRDASRG